MKIEIPDEHMDAESRKNTPKRIERFWTEWKQDQLFKFTVFDNEGYDEIIALTNIEYDSMCSHHCLPFHGVAHIGYIPDEHICGISKLARLTIKYAHRPQLQERMTHQILAELVEHLNPKGAIVVVEGHHDCMGIRGAKQRNAVMKTSAIYGVFQQKDARDEFFELVK